MQRGLVAGTILLLTGAMWFGVWRVAAFTWRVADELDNALALAELRPRPQTTVVFDRRGRPAFTFYQEQRTDVPLDSVSPRMIDAVLAVEDQRFFSHNGLDPRRIAGAAWQNLRSGRIRQGGSTLTQQLVRVAQLTPRRTFERKLREALIATRLEQRYTKHEILEAYLNTVYFGQGFHGVESASRGYFGKSAANLDAHEAALLAAVVRFPSLDAPAVAPERARSRRNLVLRLMRDQGRLDAAEYEAAVRTAVPVKAPGGEGDATRAGSVGRYFEEELRRQLVAQFGGDRVLRGGLRVYSTYDPDLQAAAEAAVTTRIAEITKGRSRAKELQGALVSLDPATGDVLALVGGRSFEASSFNRATQARRQAGSAFKPIVYAAALERGYAPGTVLSELDAVIGSGADAWLPGGEHEAPEYSLRRALTVSSNRAAAQLMQLVGVSTTAYYAQRLGIESPLPMVPSLALGTGEVTLLELTASYIPFATKGISAAPRLFTRVDDAEGQTLYHQPERHVRAISEGTAFMMSSMLADVVSSGTAAGARAHGFRLPAAGKTGTSDDYADAWFIGYTPRIVTGVWFGLDTPAPIMARGFAGTVAVPAWARFMKAATKGQKAEWYSMPGDVERVMICRRSGARATDACRHQYQFVASHPGDVMGLTPARHDAMPFAGTTSEPPVYEEFVSVRTSAVEPCPLHDPRSPIGGEVSATPIVDAALRDAAIRRVVATDGSVRYIRQ
jgi:1A family penicillin-binding protein